MAVVGVRFWKFLACFGLSVCNDPMFATTKPAFWVSCAIAALIITGCGQKTSTETVADADWGTNLEDAIANAKASGKHVYVDFTGSDWCPPCMALHDKILVKPEFLTYAKENLELVMLDFPRRKALPDNQKAYNQSLAQKYKIEGFPTVVIFDGDGKEVHREVGFPDAGQPTAYVASLKKALGQ